MIYLDHAATTAPSKEVIEEMIKYQTQFYGNPSAIYSFSYNVKNSIEAARKVIAQSLSAKSNEIYFTSGGSESDNWAIKGIAFSCKEKGNHIITSKIEHPAIMNSLRFLEENGYRVTYLNVDEFGRVKIQDLKNAICDETVLISIMFANNEIGTIQPIKEIGEIAKKNKIIFHTDAVQAYGQIPINVNEYDIDLLSASGHKLNGPKGIGFLYIRDRINITPYIHGGSQENRLRAGTENVPAIAGLKKAVEISQQSLYRKMKKEIQLRNYVRDRILNEIPYTRLNGHWENRLPNNLNFTFQFVDGPSLLIALDELGICVSSGSACSSKEKNPSHVLKAIGLTDELCHSTIRLTLGEENSKEEMDYVIECIKNCVANIRSYSPKYEDYCKNK